ncbi:MAG: methyltransferase [Flavobacteriales bacterium]|jgi:16S rRNA (guanine966-N2)-methyltransferase|nr:methyltransferase [Flavobacteriales bacterium]MDC3395155.1 RsmD family RNA methyltransferase [Flavobacteriales bacterium]MDG1349004.1 RsmD family RNA methyltransferase [Flavobacteriales bacterium]
MRIISGTHKGRRLMAPSSLPVRPTTDRAKEALFNILQNLYFFEHKNVLDLFSGTGNIAYEFASRGCEKVLAVDNNYNCINYIEETAKDLDFNISTIKSDCLQYLKGCKQEFNFIFADPPYDYDNYQELKSLIIENNLIKKDGVLIIEHDKDTEFEGENLEVRKYGTVHFSIFSF